MEFSAPLVPSDSSSDDDDEYAFGSHTSRVHIPNIAVSYLRKAYRRFQSMPDIENVIISPACVLIKGKTVAAVKDVEAVVNERLFHWFEKSTTFKKFVITIPIGAERWIIGSGGENIKQLKTVEGIYCVLLDGKSHTLKIGGQSEGSLNRVRTRVEETIKSNITGPHSHQFKVPTQHREYFESPEGGRLIDELWCLNGIKFVLYAPQIGQVLVGTKSARILKKVLQKVYMTGKASEDVVSIKIPDGARDHIIGVKGETLDTLYGYPGINLVDFDKEGTLRIGGDSLDEVLAAANMVYDLLSDYKYKYQESVGIRKVPLSAFGRDTIKRYFEANQYFLNELRFLSGIDYVVLLHSLEFQIGGSSKEALDKVVRCLTIHCQDYYFNVCSPVIKPNAVQRLNPTENDIAFLRKSGSTVLADIAALPGIDFARINAELKLEIGGETQMDVNIAQCKSSEIGRFRKWAVFPRELILEETEFTSELKDYATSVFGGEAEFLSAIRNIPKVVMVTTKKGNLIIGSFCDTLDAIEQVRQKSVPVPHILEHFNGQKQDLIDTDEEPTNLHLNASNNPSKVVRMFAPKARDEFMLSHMLTAEDAVFGCNLLTDLSALPGIDYAIVNSTKKIEIGGKTEVDIDIAQFQLLEAKRLKGLIVERTPFSQRLKDFAVITFGDYYNFLGVIRNLPGVEMASISRGEIVIGSFTEGIAYNVSNRVRLKQLRPEQSPADHSGELQEPVDFSVEVVQPRIIEEPSVPECDSAHNPPLFRREIKVTQNCARSLGNNGPLLAVIRAMSDIEYVKIGSTPHNANNTTKILEIGGKTELAIDKAVCKLWEVQDIRKWFALPADLKTKDLALCEDSQDYLFTSSGGGIRKSVAMLKQIPNVDMVAVKRKGKLFNVLIGSFTDGVVEKVTKAICKFELKKLLPKRVINV